MSPGPVKRIGSYEVERELARGGMGVVYLARQPDLDRPVVLKTLRRELASDPELEERFTREARASAAVHHQNVVALYDCFAWRGERFIAQEFVDGQDLAHVLDEVSRLPPRIAALIALEIARGLEEIHARGIVHRDVKPSNVLIGRDGAVKVTDFGIALDPSNTALTLTGHAIGTPDYMSPEQLLGERVDARSDLFSFGVLLYEMLVGDLPFGSAGDEDNPEPLVRRVESGAYPAPGRRVPETPRAVGRLVRVCLRATPRKRVQSAVAVRRALERHAGAMAPADCRAAIAGWLRERGVFEAVEPAPEQTLPLPARAAPRAAGRATSRRPWRWAAAAALLAAAISSVVTLDGGPQSAFVRLEQAVSMLLGRAPIGRIWLDAEPGTRVRIDGAGTVALPRVAPTELPPGEHVFVFTHPELGRVEHRLTVHAGVEYQLSPAFSGSR